MAAGRLPAERFAQRPKRPLRLPLALMVYLPRIGSRPVSVPLLAAYIVGLGVNVFNGIDASIWAIYLKDLGASLSYIGATYTLRAATAMLLTRFAALWPIGITGRCSCSWPERCRC